MVTKPKKRHWRPWLAFALFVVILVIASEIVQNAKH